MANTKEVRKQIASIKSTQKITSAMEMVAASKMKKTQDTMTLGGVYNNQDKEFVKKYVHKVPMGRMANTNDFSGALIFLLSDSSSYVTGADIVIDGGFSAW